MPALPGRPWLPRPPGWLGPLARWALPLAAGALGALLAIGLLGRQDSRIGPARVRLSASPAWSGSSRLSVPPFGSVSAATHRGPVRFQATLLDVDVPTLEQILDRDVEPPRKSPRDRLAATLAPLEQQARTAAAWFVARLVALGLVGGTVAAVALRRRTWTRVAACAAGGLTAVAVLLLPTLLTYDVGAFRAPRYDGALEYAPVLVGDVQTGLDRLRTLREEMERIGENLNRAYSALGAPVPALGGDTVRVLHVSDLHLNPAGFDLAERLAGEFNVAAVVDTGDLGTWGLPPERSVPGRIKEFKVPYLFVKGNHDNGAMVAAVRRNRNAVVLDGTGATVAGIRFFGVADPTFSPGRGYQVAAFERLKQVDSVKVGVLLDEQSLRPDVLMVHDPELALYAAGHVATVLDGHVHRFGTAVRQGTRELTAGTVGAAGPDGLRADQPVPYSAEVVYFDPATHRPVAVDRITVRALGSSFSVDRELLPEGGGQFVRDPLPVPPGLAPAGGDQVAPHPSRPPQLPD